MALCVSFTCRDLFALFDRRLLATAPGEFLGARHVHATVTRLSACLFGMTVKDVGFGSGSMVGIYLVIFSQYQEAAQCHKLLPRNGWPKSLSRRGGRDLR